MFVLQAEVSPPCYDDLHLTGTPPVNVSDWVEKNSRTLTHILECSGNWRNPLGAFGINVLFPPKMHKTALRMFTESETGLGDTTSRAHAVQCVCALPNCTHVYTSFNMHSMDVIEKSVFKYLAQSRH